MHANRLSSVKNNTAVKKVICTCIKIQLIVSLPILYLFTNFRGFGLVVFFVLWRKKNLVHRQHGISAWWRKEGSFILRFTAWAYSSPTPQFTSFLLSDCWSSLPCVTYQHNRYLFSSNIVLAPFKPTLFWLTEATLQTGITWKIVKKKKSSCCPCFEPFCFQCFCIYFIIKGECIQYEK